MQFLALFTHLTTTGRLFRLQNMRSGKGKQTQQDVATENVSLSRPITKGHDKKRALPLAYQALRYRWEHL